MKLYPHLFIDGAWTAPVEPRYIDVIDPTTEEVIASVAVGGTADVDKAVAAARAAFSDFSNSTLEERIRLIDRIISSYEKRVDAFSEVIAREAGIPRASRAQVYGPIQHMQVARDLLRSYRFVSRLGHAIVRREPIGVCALISPWNWPIQTKVIKLIYGLAAGCTMVAKPSENSPLSSLLLTEVLEEAGVPKGVFNLVNGSGREVGQAMSSHPEVDMVSFTGSTGAGRVVGATAAATVKRVSLELGGKSANLVLPDADLEKAARWNIQRCFFNTGQSCHAPSRILVHASQVEQILPFLVDEASQFRLGNPLDTATTMGPTVSARQFETIQRHIQGGIDEGARLVCGGVGRPEGLTRGYFVKPTVFAEVDPKMKIATAEIFGPVLAVIPYENQDDAIAIANGSIYGLGGYVFTSNRAQGYEVAKELRAGRISFNGAATDSLAPMGGYKQSGIGRSMGVFGLEEYLETKSVYGFQEEAETLPVING